MKFTAAVERSCSSSLKEALDDVGLMRGGLDEDEAAWGVVDEKVVNMSGELMISGEGL